MMIDLKKKNVYGVMEEILNLITIALPYLIKRTVAGGGC